MNCIEKYMYNIIFPQEKKKIPNLLPTFHLSSISSLPIPEEGEKYTRPTSLEQSFQRINLAIIQSRPEQT